MTQSIRLPLAIEHLHSRLLTLTHLYPRLKTTVSLYMSQSRTESTHVCFGASSKHTECTLLIIKTRFLCQYVPKTAAKLWMLLETGLASSKVSVLHGSSISSLTLPIQYFSKSRCGACMWCLLCLEVRKLMPTITWSLFLCVTVHILRILRVNI